MKLLCKQTACSSHGARPSPTHTQPRHREGARPQELFIFGLGIQADPGALMINDGVKIQPGS